MSSPDPSFALHPPTMAQTTRSSAPENRPQSKYDGSQLERRSDDTINEPQKGEETPPFVDSDSEKGDVYGDRGAVDPAIGEQSDYKLMGRYRASLIYITNQVGIGILSLPVALRTLGLIPGLICIVVLGILVTYTAYVLLQFFRRYPTVLNCVDCFRIIGGTPLAIVVGTAFVLNLILTCSSAVLTMSIALNSITEHATCTVAFIAVPAVASWLLCMPRKMTFLAHFGSKLT